MTNRLSLNRVSCGYARGLQLQDISAELAAGSVCAILGSNGAGKTTLLRAIAGLLPVTEGQIVIGSQDLAGLRPLERARQIAYVPQAAAMPSGLTVSEAMSIAAYPQGSAAWLPDTAVLSKARTLLEQFGIRQFASRQAHTLSGGELRRFMLAQGLMQLGDSGGVLLLDEPTAFLDPPARRFIAQLASRIGREQQRIVLMVLHEPELALALSTHLLLLRAGRALAFGTTADLASSPLLRTLYEDDVLPGLAIVEAA